MENKDQNQEIGSCKKEAEEKNFKFYFGKICCRNHDSGNGYTIRRTKNRECIECKRILNTKYFRRIHSTPEYKEKNRTAMANYRDKKGQAYKEYQKAYHAKWYQRKKNELNPKTE